MIFLGHKERIPKQPVRWPSLRNIWNEVTQARAASQPTRLSNQSPAQQQISSANMPQPVIPINILVRKIGTMRQVTVHFLENSADTNYQKTNLQYRLGNGNPVLVAAGVHSPLTFTLPASSASAVLLFQTEGSWGANPVQNSPSRAFNLK